MGLVLTSSICLTAFPVQTVVDLALNRPTVQISTHGTGEASHAVNGNRDPDYHRSPCTHTYAGILPNTKTWQMDFSKYWEFLKKNSSVLTAIFG